MPPILGSSQIIKKEAAEKSYRQARALIKAIHEDGDHVLVPLVREIFTEAVARDPQKTEAAMKDKNTGLQRRQFDILIALVPKLILEQRLQERYGDLIMAMFPDRGRFDLPLASNNLLTSTETLAHAAQREAEAAGLAAFDYIEQEKDPALSKLYEDAVNGVPFVTDSKMSMLAERLADNTVQITDTYNTIARNTVARANLHLAHLGALVVFRNEEFDEDTRIADLTSAKTLLDSASVYLFQNEFRLNREPHFVPPGM